MNFKEELKELKERYDLSDIKDKTFIILGLILIKIKQKEDLMHFMELKKHDFLSSGEETSPEENEV